MLRVGGLTPLSTTDWPGMLAAVVFCQGCPWRCGYCHNPDLIPPRGEREIPWDDVLSFLRRRQGLLDAVVFSGGEPTLQAGLVDAVREVRALGFRIGLHTGGMYPKKLATVLPFVDWVGMDVKAPFADYAQITAAAGSGEPALAGLQTLLASGVAHEIRTTVHPALLPDSALTALAHDLAARGVKHYVIQAFRSQGCANAALGRSATRERPLHDVGEQFADLFTDFSVRS
ncbi:putative pyruvate radical-activating enzyme [Thiobacillus denitrificans ATCC 25259]|uniref:Putative pyruvate radical-activating enzyme n=1 Tax=Thiobacillus denitrificans (strain ATCC 25259 / T1) TaxID=292415 RepID=Q3SGX0_THIDA|nr:anaerobic ribonucleoside-triphosphate reductase activating protein [Thiobacillus denitrificans]AAZ98123.1 putative pyruvate radical-activating enzyme [Thiobacillus denitrificans ATCC 25259]